MSLSVHYALPAHKLPSSTGALLTMQSMFQELLKKEALRQVSWCSSVRYRPDRSIACIRSDGDWPVGWADVQYDIAVGP